MLLIKDIAQAFWKSFQATFLGRQFPTTTTTAWDSMVLAASEEWVDDTIFQFFPPLPVGRSSDDLAKYIIGEAVNRPDLDTLKEGISSEFCLSERDAFTAVDRALGGICRAATLRKEACPDCHVDPVGAAAFARALDDHTIIDSIYPGWVDWRSGCHSSPPRISSGDNYHSEDPPKKLTDAPDMTA